MKTVVVVVLAAAALAVVGAQSGCSRQCIRFTLTTPAVPAEVANDCDQALALNQTDYFRRTFFPDLARVMGPSVISWSNSFTAARRWDMEECSWMPVALGGGRPTVYETLMLFCGEVIQSALGPAIAKALDYGTWSGSVPLKEHASNITGYALVDGNGKRLCVSSKIEAFDPDSANPQCRASTDSVCQNYFSPPPSLNPPPRIAPPPFKQPVGPVDADKYWSTCLDVENATCCANLTAYFIKTFLPEVASVMRQQGASNATIGAFVRQPWRLNDCSYSLLNRAVMLYASTFEMCTWYTGNQYQVVAPALLRALSYRTWRGATSLDQHARVLTGQNDTSADVCPHAALSVYGFGEGSGFGSGDEECSNWGVDIRSTNDNPKCAASDARTCDVTWVPPPPEAPDCRRACFKWGVAQDRSKSVFLKADGSLDCSPAVRDFKWTFGYSVQSILQAQVAAKQLDQRVVDAFAADMDSFKLERCEAGTSADGKFHHLKIAVCGELSAYGVDSALSKYLRTEAKTSGIWQGAALSMTGFQWIGPPTCRDFSFEAWFFDDSESESEEYVDCTTLRTGWDAVSCPSDASFLRMDRWDIGVPDDYWEPSGDGDA
ncbi:hypothetical protein HYH03_012530 [Edaphochlamys debaryana]|uniref:C-type lectin domain-containing protein n=1 Tax=Edaphochlamys debaryana TaxID=47281 RepID=A0A835XXX3_9CHLO|nr:hypothetical protein HYH03_012530 [Edaphochlamys debaryana]|eukprot:KAG2488900.1 hypothetical protein HYH03_012530 [Edaphochlamys debaryana]